MSSLANCALFCSPHAADRRQPELRSGRDVPAVVVEPAVATDTAGDQRFGDGEVGQQLLLGELNLHRTHACSPPGSSSAVTLGYILTRIQTESKLLPRAERRAAILHGAALAFASSGFADTSMDDVGTACGVTKLIVYRHFGSKEELYREILQQVFDHLGVELPRSWRCRRTPVLAPAHC